VPTTNGYANCYCAKKIAGIQFFAGFRLQGRQLLGRADVSSQAQAIDERKRFPRKMPTP
jgi:hypothetical protein